MKRKLAGMALPKGLTPIPFNSGYFMSFYCEGFSAEALRKKLLYEMGIGTCLCSTATSASRSPASKRRI